MATPERIDHRSGIIGLTRKLASTPISFLLTFEPTDAGKRFRQSYKHLAGCLRLRSRCCGQRVNCDLVKASRFFIRELFQGKLSTPAGEVHSLLPRSDWNRASIVLRDPRYVGA